MEEAIVKKERTKEQVPKKQEPKKEDVQRFEKMLRNKDFDIDMFILLWEKLF